MADEHDTDDTSNALSQKQDQNLTSAPKPSRSPGDIRRGEVIPLQSKWWLRSDVNEF